MCASPSPNKRTRDDERRASASILELEIRWWCVLEEELGELEGGTRSGPVEGRATVLDAVGGVTVIRRDYGDASS